MNQEEFFATPSMQPWAEMLRPRRISEVVGQQHLLAPGMPLATAFKAGAPHSMILWGPPGVGKTTLARLMAQEFNCELIALSAVFSGVKDIRTAMEQAKQNLIAQQRTILFVDEIHRFNKSQQDALLPYVESGLVVLVGATTENPSFEVNSALLSRAKVYLLKSLTDAELAQLILQIQQRGLLTQSIDATAQKIIINYADGDARKLLNFLEQLANSTDSASELISAEEVTNNLAQMTRLFDKNGEYFYDLISALHKSVRGSNPDAALYWLCRILDASGDAKYLARRIVRMAWEDIGLADPRAIQLAVNAAESYERLGSPEGDLALAQAVIYLAVAAKSNAGYSAFKQAEKFVKNDRTRPVPLHLRNAPTKLMHQLGYGNAYRYPHDEAHAYAAGENYLPENMSPPKWYRPTNRGLEEKIAKKMQFLCQLDATDADE